MIVCSLVYFELYIITSFPWQLILTKRVTYLLARNLMHQHNGQFPVISQMNCNFLESVNTINCTFLQCFMQFPSGFEIFKTCLKVYIMSMSLYSIIRLTFTKWVSKIFIKCADVGPSSSHYFPQQIWIFLTLPTWLKLPKRILFLSLYSVRNYSYEYL